MKRFLSKFTKNILKQLNLEITNYHKLQSLKEYEQDINLILKLPNEKVCQLISLADKSKSQIKQDLFVLSELNFKRGGFFVEFGATNGIDLSNTYLLEKEFGWDGILAEPARCWHSELYKNRTCDIETSCVWRESNSVLNFSEVNLAELSTVSSFSKSDFHYRARKNKQTYNVNTISLIDLLKKFNAPNEIDYLSIDTEGSEYEILKNFDFGLYHFNVITCEHNFSPVREKLFNLLSKNGYTRKYSGLSKWDDWYVKEAKKH